MMSLGDLYRWLFYWKMAWAKVNEIRYVVGFDGPVSAIAASA
jgi:hypothetical protein